MPKITGLCSLISSIIWATEKDLLKSQHQLWMLNTSLRGVSATYTQVLLAGTLAACWQELQRSTFAQSSDNMFVTWTVGLLLEAELQKWSGESVTVCVWFWFSSLAVFRTLSSLSPPELQLSEELHSTRLRDSESRQKQLQAQTKLCAI